MSEQVRASARTNFAAMRRATAYAARKMCTLHVAPWVVVVMVFALTVCSIESDPAGDPGSDGMTACDGPTLDTCIPAYEPTWSNVYAQTIVPSCQGTAECHESSFAMGASPQGLYFEDSAQSLAVLLEGGVPRVVPGQPRCSPLLERLLADDPLAGMPPADPLPQDELCAVVQWIEQGAKGR